MSKVKLKKNTTKYLEQIHGDEITITLNPKQLLCLHRLFTHKHDDRIFEAKLKEYSDDKCLWENAQYLAEWGIMQELKTKSKQAIKIWEKARGHNRGLAVGNL